MNIATTYSRRLSVFVALLGFLLVTSGANAQSFHVEPTSGFLEFNTHAGGQATQTLYLQNLTTSPLMLNAAISGDASGQFSMNSLPLITLIDTARKAVMITYSPAAVSEDTAMLTITSTTDTQMVYLYGHSRVQDDSDENEHEGDIRVTDEMNFRARVGESQCIPITLANTSLSAVTLSNFQIVGGNNQFSLSSADSGSLAAGALDTITICYTPVQGSGDARAELTFNYSSLLDSLMTYVGRIELNGHVLEAENGGDSLYFNVDRMLNFQDVTVGTQSCQTLRISNPTAQAVTIDSAAISGGSAGSYTVSGATNLLVGANSVQYINVCFTPTVAGEHQNGTLTLYYSANDSMNGELYVALHGSTEIVDTNNGGMGSNHCLRVRRSIGVIGPIVQGGTATGTIYLTNNTGSSVSVNSVSLMSGDSAAFNVAAAQFPLSIASGAQGQFDVTFTPANANAIGQVRYTSQVQVMATGDSLTCGPITIQVGGVAIPGNHRDTTHHSLGGHLSSDDSLDLGNVIAISTNSSGTTTDTLTFYNTTDAPITVNSIYMAPTPNLSLVGSSVTTPTVIQPGGQLQAYVQFNSNGQVGTVYTTPLYIATDQSIQPQMYEVQAIQQAPLGVTAVTPSSINFSIVPNPSSGDFRVVLPSAPASVAVEVFDLLGNHVASLNTASNLSWNGVDDHGTVVPAGVYIVRVSGRDMQGNEFRATKQVAIQR